MLETGNWKLEELVLRLLKYLRALLLEGRVVVANLTLAVPK